VVISKKNQSKNCVIFVIWLNIVIIVARSVRLLPAHMREDVHATRQLHCQWQVSAMPNMQKMLLQFTTLV